MGKDLQRLCFKRISFPAQIQKLCRDIIHDFDSIEILISKPRVGIVGEILVKFLPAANNHLVELLEAEGAEAVVPDLADFLQYCFITKTSKSLISG